MRVSEAVARHLLGGAVKGIPAELTTLVARLHAWFDYIPEQCLLVKHSRAAGPAIRMARAGPAERLQVTGSPMLHVSS